MIQRWMQHSVPKKILKKVSRSDLVVIASGWELKGHGFEPWYLPVKKF